MRRKKRRMNIVRPKIYVERTFTGLGFVDKRYRCVDVGGGNLVTLHPTDRPVPKRIGSKRILLRLFAVVGIEKWKNTRTEALEACERLVKAVLSDQGRIADVPLATHVPLAEVARCIASIVQNPREHWR